MKKTRRKFTSEFKSKVVVEALSERYTASQLAESHNIHPNQIAQWKRHFLDNASKVFDGKAKDTEDPADQEKAQLMKVIGELTVANKFLKKNLGIKD